MKTLIWIELKKLMLEKKRWFYAALILAVLLFPMASIVRVQEQTFQFFMSAEQDRLEQLAGNIDSMQKELTSDDYPEDTLQTMRNILAGEQEEFVWQQRLVEAVEKGDWKTQLDYEIKRQEKWLEGILDGSIISGTSAEHEKDEILFKKYLRKHEIRPMYEGKMNMLSYMSGPGMHMLLYLLPVLALVCSYDCIMKEQNRKTGRFLFQQPYKREHFLQAKLVAAWLLAVGQSILIVAVSCTVMTLICGVGDGGYPLKASPWMLQQIQIGSQFYVTTISYLLQKGALLLVIMACMAVGGVCLSVLMKNKVMMILLAAALCLTPFLLAQTKENILDRPFVWAVCLVLVLALFVACQRIFKRRADL